MTKVELHLNGSIRKLATNFQSDIRKLDFHKHYETSIVETFEEIIHNGRDRNQGQK